MAISYGTADSLRVRLKGPYGSVTIRTAEVSLAPEEWKGAVSPYSQTVALSGITLTSKVDLQPDSLLLERMRLSGFALAAENDNGQVTVYAFGGKPAQSITLQATITEVQK